MHYFQTVTGGLNMAEVSLAVVIFNALCMRSDEGSSEFLLVLSFTFFLAGFYLLLNGCIAKTITTQPPIALELGCHLLAFFSFFAVGSFTLTWRHDTPRTVIAAAFAVTNGFIHLYHGIYLYRGDYQRWTAG